MSPPYALFNDPMLTQCTYCTGCGCVIVRDASLGGVSMETIMRVRPYLCAECYAERHSHTGYSVTFKRGGVRF